MINDKDLQTYGLNIVCDNAYDLATDDKAAFTTLRRCGLGASDSSIYLGVNKFTTVDELIAQKLTTEVTPEEIAIGEKEVVRKGADLEPIILDKFTKWSGLEVHKPNAMYQLADHPQLTINFDGIALMGEQHIPIEAKFVSIYANKYWDKSKAIEAIHQGTPKVCAGAGVADHIEQEAQLYGIPAYYYTQVQQQLLALKAPFGYLAAIFDKGWEFKVFKIYADKFVQQNLVASSAELWKIIEERKRAN